MENNFGKAFKNNEGAALRKEKRTLFVLSTEKSVKACKGNYASTYGMSTMEFVQTFTSRTLLLPEIAKIHSVGTNKDFDFMFSFSLILNFMCVLWFILLVHCQRTP